MTKAWVLGIVAAVVLSTAGVIVVNASDHDDGEFDEKGRAYALTDLYTFREDWHSGVGGDSANLILVMNTNPRSLPQQQYYFSTKARYEFHIKRVADRTVAYTSGEHILLRFTFSAPDTNDRQSMTLTTIRDGVTTTTVTTESGGSIYTTPLGSAVASNSLSVTGSTLTVFAGLREDPFFFDVERFFTWRAGVAANGGTAPPSSGFAATTAAAEDFAAYYNVNAIVARVPISWLRNGAAETTFDVWETVSIPQ